MPIQVFGIEDVEQINRDKIKFVHAQLPILADKEAVLIEEVDALIQNRDTESFHIEPVQIVRVQLGFTTYGIDNDGNTSVDFLDITSNLLISEMTQITTADAPTSTRAFTRSGYWPQFIARQQPYVGSSMTIGAKYVKELNRQLKIFCRVKYSIVKVSDAESVLFT